MTYLYSRVPDALSALVTLLRNTAGIDAATVYDGPFLSDDTPRTAIYVGYDGNPEGDLQAITGWEQSWVGLGTASKDENFSIQCAVISWSGDTDIALQRGEAFTVFGLIADQLRACATGGSFGLPQPTTVALAGGEVYQEHGNFGLQIRINFSVSVQTRI